MKIKYKQNRKKRGKADDRKKREEAIRNKERMNRSQCTTV
jgi:hypothetical protein